MELTELDKWFWAAMLLALLVVLYFYGRYFG
jgi:hypothetical protein